MSGQYTSYLSRTVFPLSSDEFLAIKSVPICSLLNREDGVSSASLVYLSPHCFNNEHDFSNTWAELRPVMYYF